MSFSRQFVLLMIQMRGAINYLWTVIINQGEGRKTLDILEKLPKMPFEEKIVEKCVLTFLVTKPYY